MNIQLSEMLNEYLTTITNGDKSKFSFFVSIFDYVKFISENETTAKIINETFKEREKLSGNITENEEKIIIEAVELKKRLEEILSKEKINDPQIINLLNEFEQHMDGRIIGSNGKSRNLYIAIIAICRRLVNLEKIEFFESVFCIQDNDEKIPTIVLKDGIEKLVNEHEVLKNRFDFQRESSVWGACEKIFEVYDVIRALNEDGPEVKNGFFDNFWTFAHIGAMKKIKDHGLQRDNYFAREDYIGHVRRVNNEILKNIKDEETNEQFQIQPTNIELNYPRSTIEIQEKAAEGMRWTLDRQLQEQLQRKRFKQDRILQSKEDKYIHAINEIIERLESYDDGQTNISIDYHYFNFEDRMDDSKIFERFLDKLVHAGCLEKFGRSNYASGTNFSFIGVNLKKLKEYKTTLGEEKKDDGENTVYLSPDGDLYRKPKNQFCYPMEKDSNRCKIVKYLSENFGYQKTALIKTNMGAGSIKTVNTEIGKIRNNIKKYLRIEGKDLINGKKGSGYRINPRYKIIKI